MNQNKIIGRPKVPFSQQYLIIICCWLNISQKQSFPTPLSKISWHCYTAHSSIISKKSQGGHTKNHITPALTGSHRCYQSDRVSTTLRHSNWFFLPKEYGVNDLIIQVFTAKRLLFPSLKGSMWNAAFKKSPWVIPSWPFLGGMGTGRLPLKAWLGSTPVQSFSPVMPGLQDILPLLLKAH